MQFAARSERLSSPVPPSVGDALRTPGRTLDSSVRAQFEPQFGHDFSRVRVHTDRAAQESASSLNAHAYTLGEDVVFGAGEYAPHSDAGRSLLAHELTHVVQQANGTAPRTVQCKLKSWDSLDSYLAPKAAGFTKSGDEYGHPGMTTSNVSDQITVDLLHSPRVFKVAAAAPYSPGWSVDQHVAARKGILDFAAKKKYKFGAGTNFKMNPKYWDWDAASKTGKIKAGVDPVAATNDLNVNPQEYAIACEAATKITMAAGSRFSPLVKDVGMPADDWIPGDWGYIQNTKFSGKAEDAGLEGENLIYTGYSKFWGHFGTTNAYKTYDEWFKQVQGWNGGARLDGHRQRPARGLV